MALLTRAAGAVLALAMLALPTGGAWASGPAEDEPWYVDQYGGDMPDVAQWWNGRIGIVMPTAPRPMRFIDWRLLHGLKMGPAAGDALSSPCCGQPSWLPNASAGRYGWQKARALVTGQEDASYIPTDRKEPDGSFTPNCFDQAFDTAAATLQDRIKRYGAASSAVKAWVAAQDAVFQACSMYGVALPAPMPGAPAWLTQDRAYQQAALDLYSARNVEAARGFTAIARDPASPWRGSGLYLAARASVREALTRKTPDAYARAREAAAALQKAPDAFGHGDAAGLLDVLDFHQTPDAFLAQRTRELNAPTPGPELASRFRDYTDLGEAAKAAPEALDWIDTIRAHPANAAVTEAHETVVQAVARYESARKAAFQHAWERWRATRDIAWLVAAASLVDEYDIYDGSIIPDLDNTPASSPAFIDLQHQRVRLTLWILPADDSRRRLDGLLARQDLSVSDRNVFMAERAQVASSLDDFARFALRKRLCIGADNFIQDDRPSPPACLRERWVEDVQPSGIYDGEGDKGTTGLGEDALAIIDRAPLSVRIALSRNPALPARIRLDIALTSYARAVQLQDNGAIDGLARSFAPLLPLMAEDFRAIPAARPGPAKRFAEFLVLAKIPGLRVDLVDYVRPEGKHVADFQRYWTDWVILKTPERGLTPPPLALYQETGTGYEPYLPDSAWPDALTDLTCLGECGRGRAPLRTPDFLAPVAGKAAAERAFLFKTDHEYDKPEPAPPPGAVDAWDEILAYAAAHPRDPRIPEALYWLVHVGHFGGTHNHSGRRAFLLLHQRYPASAWAKKTKYYND